MVIIVLCQDKYLSHQCCKPIQKKLIQNTHWCLGWQKQCALFYLQHKSACLDERANIMQPSTVGHTCSRFVDRSRCVSILLRGPESNVRDDSPYALLWSW